jgi:hypothetical protein
VIQHDVVLSAGELDRRLPPAAIRYAFIPMHAEFQNDVFIPRLMPTGQFAPVVDLDYMTKGFVEFQMDKNGKLNLLRLASDGGQAYEFRRE